MIVVLIIGVEELLCSLVYFRVDTYGASISRDICPTDESGSVYYDIMSSCLSVARLGAVNGGLGGPLSAPCTVAGELCCEYNETTDGFVNVWSMAQASPGADRLLTIHSEEVKTLVARGWGTEVSNS